MDFLLLQAQFTGLARGTFLLVAQAEVGDAPDQRHHQHHGHQHQSHLIAETSPKRPTHATHAQFEQRPADTQEDQRRQQRPAQPRLAQGRADKSEHGQQRGHDPACGHQVLHQHRAWGKPQQAGKRQQRHGPGTDHRQPAQPGVIRTATGIVPRHADARSTDQQHAHVQALRTQRAQPGQRRQCVRMPVGQQHLHESGRHEGEEAQEGKFTRTQQQRHGHDCQYQHAGIQGERDGQVALVLLMALGKPHHLWAQGAQQVAGGHHVDALRPAPLHRQGLLEGHGQPAVLAARAEETLYFGLPAGRTAAQLVQLHAIEAQLPGRQLRVGGGQIEVQAEMRRSAITRQHHAGVIHADIGAHVRIQQFDADRHLPTVMA